MPGDFPDESLGISHGRAEEILNKHKLINRRYWLWSDRVLQLADAEGRIRTLLRWQMRITPETKRRSIRNFHMQAHGAEILRLACCMMSEQGIEIVAMVHDAVLITASLDLIDAHVAIVQECFARASERILGHTLQTEVEQIVRHPDRFVGKGGKEMWELVSSLLEEISGSSA